MTKTVDHCDKTLKNDDILRKGINKVSQKKKVMRDPPGFNNTGLYTLKYEYFEQNSENQNFESNENQACVLTDFTNIHRGNSSNDITRTVLTLTNNKFIDRQCCCCCCCCVTGRITTGNIC